MSENIRKLEVPEGKIDARLGDVHIYGNPHYQLNPENGIVMADEALEKLSEYSPADAGYFKANHDAFVKKLKEGIERWKKAMAPFKGKSVAASHSCLLYFFDAFGLKQAGYIESKPGIPPSPAEVLALEKKIKDEGTKRCLWTSFLTCPSRKRYRPTRAQRPSSFRHASTACRARKIISSYLIMTLTGVRSLKIRKTGRGAVYGPAAITRSV